MGANRRRLLIPASDSALLLVLAFLITRLSAVVCPGHRRYYQHLPHHHQVWEFGRSTVSGYPVYWNVPTFMCHKHGYNFSQVAASWGLVQNEGDRFRGEGIALLYDPGLFPALLQTTKGGAAHPRNGGVPQEGSLADHLAAYQRDVDKLIPDKNFKGIAIIDFEHWRPIWRENWGSLDMYRVYSRKIVKKYYPWFDEKQVEKEAMIEFERAAKSFLLDTFRVSKKLRPLARWGYYGYPFCFNYKPSANGKLPCTQDVIHDNNRLKWFFEQSTALYPSLYLKSEGMNERSRADYIAGRMEEALRQSHVGRAATPVLPYTWYKYSDANRFLSREDLISSLHIPKKKGASGVIVWGATNDVNTKEKCAALHDYVDRILGPAIKRLKQKGAGRKGSRFRSRTLPPQSVSDTDLLYRPPAEFENEVILV